MILVLKISRNFEIERKEQKRFIFKNDVVQNSRNQRESNLDAFKIKYDINN